MVEATVAMPSGDTSTSNDSAPSSDAPLSDAELSSLLQDYAAVLAQTEHRADAVLLMGLAVQSAHRVRVR